MDLFCVLLSSSPKEQSAGKSMSIFLLIDNISWQFLLFQVLPFERLKYAVGEGRLLNQHVATALKCGVVLQEVNNGTTTTII